jgi:phospholipid/cholesterol/gamma-HCH transport system ATP-binding protein
MSAIPPANPAISLEGIRIGFEEREVLRGVSFSVPQGDTLALLGESGCGKTLVLKMVAGLLRPDEGRIHVLGQEITAMREAALLDFRRQIGIVFQEGALFDSLTVEENVAYRLREELADEVEIGQRVDETLRFVEMQEAKEKLPGELSGGMRRRVAIARALATRPPIVLYDSPTAGLDPVTSQRIITLILRLRDVYGVTSLLATQRLQDAFALANFHFVAERGVVERLPLDGHGPAAVPPSAGRGAAPLAPGALPAPSTRFLFLRNGTVYFEGDQEALTASRDSYLERFLV